MQLIFLKANMRFQVCMSSMCFLFVFQNTVGDATDETE